MRNYFHLYLLQILLCKQCYWIFFENSIFMHIFRKNLRMIPKKEWKIIFMNLPKKGNWNCCSLKFYAGFIRLHRSFSIKDYFLAAMAGDIIQKVKIPFRSYWHFNIFRLSFTAQFTESYRSLYINKKFWKAKSYSLCSGWSVCYARGIKKHRTIVSLYLVHNIWAVWIISPVRQQFKWNF